MNQLSTINNQEVMTAQQVRAGVGLIQEVMRDIMKEGTHYGTIPGCKQPSLLKAGAEKILTTFRIAVEPEVEDLSTPDEVRYRVKVRGIHQTSGIVVGIGVGECSSNEEKYKWRKAVSIAEYNSVPEDRRRVKYYKDGTANQIRTEPADLANTVLKMAKKRGMVDLSLTATAASDIFTQDVEDMPDELREVAQESRPPVQQPQSRSAPAGKLTEGQLRIIRAKAENAAINESDICTQFKVSAITDIDASLINDVLAWVANPS